MKKLLVFFVVTVICVSACEGPMGPMGPDGRDGINGEVTYWKIIDFPPIKGGVTGGDWELVNAPNQIGSYYRYVFDVPEITEEIYENGLIIAYYRYKDDHGDNVQSVLPYTYYDIDVDVDDDGKINEYPYCVQYSYDVMPGSIAFKLVFSDFLTDGNGPPSLCSFRLQLLY